jgi:hypothetical protein
MRKPRYQASQTRVVPDPSQAGKSQNIRKEPGKTGARGVKKSRSGMRWCHVKCVYNTKPQYILL